MSVRPTLAVAAVAGLAGSIITTGTGGTGSTASYASDSPSFVSGTVLVGYSNKGRSIIAKRQGNPLAPRRLLVIGSMHGNEPKGIPVVKGVRRSAPPSDEDVQIWTITTMNPDGTQRRSRNNARNVDLNRNFPTGWSKKTPHSGRGPASEIETRNITSFISQLRPDAVLSFHQHANTVFSICNAQSRAWVRRTGKLMKLPVPKKADCKAEDRRYKGTMNNWYTSKFSGVFATVELPPSRRVTAKKIKLYVKATRTLATEMPDRVSG